MRMISCISPISEGTLRVLGMNPATDGPRIRARMGLVPQEDSFDLELTVLDNLMIYGRYFDMPKPIIRERAEQLLDFAQLTERADDRVDPLSGGMKRRLTIARALISDPDLLILDEPTTGLDPQARHLLWDRLYRLKQEGVTLVITTHYMDEAEQLCDRLVVMDQGRFAAEGTPRQLIEHVLDQGGRRAPVRPGRARGDRSVVWPLWPSVRRCCRTASSCTRTTATPPWPRWRAWATWPGPRSYAARPSKTSSCASPAAPWSTDLMAAVTSADAPKAQVLFPHGEALPRRRIATPMWLRAASYWGYQYKRTWRSSVVTSFLIPVLYLAAMGIALGSLIDKHSHGVDGVSYVAFLAPGLLAGTCMQIGDQRGHVSGDGRHQVDADVPRPAGDTARASTTCCSGTWRGSRRACPSSSPSTWR